MESGRRNVWSGGPWEDRVGYSRAVRVGPHVWVAGTTAMTSDGLVGRGNAYAQAKQAFETIRRALEEVGADLDHVVRTRMFVIDIAVNGDAIGRVHGELFGAIRPAATMLEVPRLIEHGMLVEVEVEAYVPERKA